MPPRNTVTEIIQVGKESTYGTAVAATRKMGGASIALAPEMEHTTNTPKGFKNPTIEAPNREWASGTIGGFPVYNEMPYFLCSLFKDVSPVTATGVSTWTIDPSVGSVETVASYTVEEGDSATRAHKVSGVVVTDLAMDFPRNGDPSLTGTVIGQRITDAITPTGSLTTVTLEPITGPQIDVFVDASWAALGTTKILGNMRAAWSVGGMWGPQWVNNTALNSYKALVQQAPTGTVTLAVEADASGMAYLTNMRAGSSQFIRIKATGPIFTGATNYSLTCDFAGKVHGPWRWVDIDGVRCAEWTFNIVFDATGNAANKFVVVGNLTAL